MTHNTKWFTFIQFFSQILFLIVVIVVGSALRMDTVESGQAGQLFVSVVGIPTFTYAWGWKLPNRAARRELPEGSSLWLEGFRQNWRTVRQIYHHYRKGVWWFMLATLVAEAGVTSLVPVSITFLSSELKLDGLEIGIVFAIALIASLPGTFLGAWITAKHNPRNSWTLNLSAWCVVTVVGSFVLTADRAYLAYVWAVLWGILLGWYYPVENLFFSLSVPPGQEAEMTGFFVYTIQLLSWLPPMVVSFIVEAGVNTRWGFFSLIGFQLAGIGCLSRVAPWEEVLEEAKKVL